MPWGIGHALMAVGTVALVEGDVQRARASCTEAVEALTGTSDSWEAVLLLAESELLLGDLESATRSLGTGMELLRAVRDVTGIADAARVAGLLALHRGDPETAAMLTGAFAHILEDAGLSLFQAHWQHAYLAATERLRAVLGGERFDEACSRGAQLTEGEVLDLAARVASGDAPDTTQPSTD
jgi:ATP/maltotriose-dependent transcriptional regulator MalT